MSWSSCHCSLSEALNNLVKKAQQDEDWEAHPAPLNEGEEKFLRDLHHFVSEKAYRVASPHM